MTSVRFLNGLTTNGGNIVEIATATSRVITDFGIPTGFNGKLGEAALGPGQLPNLPELFGDTADQFAHEAIVITHWHPGHWGALPYLNRAIPIYLSPQSLALAQAMGQCQGLQLHALPLETPLAIGDLTITGFASDHSEPGTMAVMIEDREHAYLNSGDVRRNGPHADRVAHWVQVAKQRRVKMLFLEATAFGAKPQPTGLTEDALQQAFGQQLKAASKLVVLDADVTNWERLAAFQATAHAHSRQMVWSPLAARVLQTVAGVAPDVAPAAWRTHPERYVAEAAALTDDAALPISSYVQTSNTPALLDAPLCRLIANAHATPAQLIALCQQIAPQIVVPWHTQAPQAAADALDAQTLAEVLLPERELYYSVDED